MGNFYKGIKLPNESGDKLLKIGADKRIQATDSAPAVVPELDTRVEELEGATMLISQQLEEINGEVV